MQVASGYILRLCGRMKGDRCDEGKLHEHFGEYKLKGEWYLPANEILEFIEQNCTWEHARPRNTIRLAMASSHSVEREILDRFIEIEKCYRASLNELEEANSQLRVRNHELKKEMSRHSHELDELMQQSFVSGSMHTTQV